MFLRLGSLLALVACLGTSACTSAPAKRFIVVLEKPGFGKRHCVSPSNESIAVIGDTISIRDPNNGPELNTNMRVALDGTISLPVLGALAVAGCTRSELEEQLMQRYSPFYPVLGIHVEIGKTAPGSKYFIYGEVGLAGQKPFGGDLTVLEAVLQARPSSGRADLEHVRVIRSDSLDLSALDLDLRALPDRGAPSADLQLRELDIVFVPALPSARVADLREAAEREAFATIGDTIRIRDPLHPQVLDLEKRIDIDGTVLLPELGAVAVAGYTASELETLLRERWAPFFGKLDLHVVIESTGAQGVYFIYGEVGAPGEKRLLLDATVFEAVMAANPDAVKADLAHVRVFRGQATDGQVVDLALMRRTGDSSSNVAVQAFDVIFVPPTLAARLAGLFEGFRAWLREGVVPPPILIAGKEPQ